MAKVQIQMLWNEMLKEPWVESLVSEQASAIASRCGDGYESKTKLTGTRYIGVVWADTAEAKQDNRDNNTILKNVR